MRLIRLLLILCVGLLVCGCVPREPSPLRVATNVWPGYESLYLARHLGLYDDTRIHLVEMLSASEVSRALRSRRVEAAALTLDEALSLEQDGVDLRVVLIMDISDGADVLIARQQTDNLQALKGKRIGVESGAVGAVMLDAALSAAGLRVDDIRIVSLNPDEHLSAWRRHMVDALVTFDPVRGKLLEEGGHVLFDSHQIPGRILDVLVVRTEVLARQGDALRQLLAGHFAALRHIREHPRKAADLMAPRLGMEAASVLTQFSGLGLPGLSENRAWLTGPHARLDGVAGDLRALMLDRRLLQKKNGLASLADGDYLPEYEP